MKEKESMFTGIIKEVGQLKNVEELSGSREFTIVCKLAANVKIDQSININGVCHTVTQADAETFTVQSVDETLRKTNMGKMEAGDLVNLEPSLSPQQLLDGHLVQGHVDATGIISSIVKEGTDYLFSIGYDESFRDLIVGRGSITIDGISLTVAREKECTFTVAIIPYTYHHTNLSKRKAGESVNLEFDILGKYVVRYLQNHSS